MKTICARCAALISITCDHCGTPLLATGYAGSTFDTGSMVCLSGQTPIVYSKSAIDAFPAAKAACPQCAALTDEDRANLPAQIITNHTMRFPLEKRGPTQVHNAPTNTRTDQKKKDGGA